MFVLIFSCLQNEEQPSQNSPPLLPSEVNVQILPQTPNANDDLYCTIEGDPADHIFTWIAKNRPEEHNGSVLPARKTLWGDQWSCLVKIKELDYVIGRDDREIINDCENFSSPENDVYLRTQEDYHNFCKYHNRTQGDLWIQGGDDLSDLSCLCEVGGSVYFNAVPELTGNQILPNLINIDGGVHFFQINHLTSIQFPKLEEINDSLHLTETSLINVSAPMLSKINGKILIEGNSSLEILYVPRLISINSSLSIRNNQNIEMFINSLQRVGGDIRITKNQTLTSIPLEHLVEINGDLDLQENNGLVEVVLPKLSIISEGIKIKNNLLLQHISIPQIPTLGEALSIKENHNLETVDFSNLTEIGSFYTIENNNELQSIEHPELSHVQGNFHLRILPELEYFNIKLNTVQDDLRIQQLDSLPEIYLEELTHIGGSLFFDQNLQIVSLNLPRLLSVNEITIVGNNSLENLEFPLLTEIAESVNISYNMSLGVIYNLLNSVHNSFLIHENTNLHTINLPHLKITGGNIRISSNQYLRDIFIPNLKEIGQSMELTENLSLENLNFDSVEQIKNNLILEQLPTIKTISSYSNLQSIGENLWLSENPELDNIQFPVLEEIGQTLYVNELKALTSFDSFQQLKTIGADLDIQNNDSLGDLQGLFSLNTLSGNLKINANPILPMSSIEELTQHLLTHHFNGTIIVSGNLE